MRRGLTASPLNVTLTAAACLLPAYGFFVTLFGIQLLAAQRLGAASPHQLSQAIMCLAMLIWCICLALILWRTAGARFRGRNLEWQRMRWFAFGLLFGFAIFEIVCASIEIEVLVIYTLLMGMPPSLLGWHILRQRGLLVKDEIEPPLPAE